MKHFSFCILTSLFFFSYSLAIADPGVIIEAKGKVTITESGKTKPALSGTQFANGSTIEISTGGNVTLMFANGSIKKLKGGEKFTAVKESASQSSNSGSIIKGITMAYNDASNAGKGPTVHGMVKATPTTKIATNAEHSVERKGQMQADLKQVDSLKLEKDGRALMQAQVFYKYQQYQKTVNTLLPIYKSQKPPTEMIKNLIAISYEKMGNFDTASKFR